MKKIVSLFLTAMLFAAMLGVPVMAEDAEPVEILAVDSGVLTTDLSGFYATDTVWTADKSVWLSGQDEDSSESASLKSTGQGTVQSSLANNNPKEVLLFIKFDVTDDIESNQKVTLRLTSDTTARDSEIVIYRVLNNNWGVRADDEAIPENEWITPTKNVDGSYSPAIEAATHCGTVTEKTGSYFDIDVTNLIKRAGVYSFAVRNVTRTGETVFGYKNFSKRPKLIIEEENSTVINSATVKNLPSTDSGYASGSTLKWTDGTEVRAGDSTTNGRGRGVVQFTIPESISGTTTSVKLGLTPSAAPTPTDLTSIIIYRIDDNALVSGGLTEYIDTANLNKYVSVSTTTVTANTTMEFDVSSLIDETDAGKTVNLMLVSVWTDPTSNSYIKFYGHTGSRTNSADYYLVERQPSLTIEYTPDEIYYIQDETTKTTSNVTRNIKLINNKNEGTPVSIIAQYDASGKLIAADVEKFTRDGWVESVSQNVAITGASSQVFLWRDLGNLIPIRVAE